MKNLHTEALIKCEPPPVSWVVEHVAAKGCVTLLYGAPGVGKSLLALAMVGAATDTKIQQIGGFTVQTVPGALVDAENSEEELARRLIGMNFNGQCGTSFQAYSPENVSKSNTLTLIAANASSTLPIGFNAGLLVLDSLRTLWFGDENSSQEVSEMLTGLQLVAQEYNTAIILIHHPRRDGGFRGSGAMSAIPEIVIEMGRWQRDLDPHRRYLVWKKCRVAAEPPRQWVRINQTFRGLEIEHASKPTREEMSWED